MRALIPDGRLSKAGLEGSEDGFVGETTGRRRAAGNENLDAIGLAIAGRGDIELAGRPDGRQRKIGARHGGGAMGLRNCRAEKQASSGSTEVS